MKRPERTRGVRGRIWEDLRGEVHRVNGPAIEEDDGTKDWYWHGELRLKEWNSGYCDKFWPGFRTPPWRMEQEENF